MLRAQAGAHTKAPDPAISKYRGGAENGGEESWRALDDVVVAQTLSQARFGQLHLGA